MQLPKATLAFALMSFISCGGGEKTADNGAAAPARPHLIWYGAAGTVPGPGIVAKNADLLDTMPFDGLCVDLGELSLQVVDDKPLAYDTVAAALKPMKEKKLKNVTQNFAIVTIPPKAPPDFFDDWATIKKNFANFTRAAHDAGLVGIAFDNEDYAQDPAVGGVAWSIYPDNCKYASTKTLADYQNQVRARGKEIMAAMIKEFPAIVVVSFYGPYTSEPKAPPELAGEPNDLHGPLFVGFLEAVKEAKEHTGATAKVVDGGELYSLRTDTDFETAYRFRKIGIASPKIDCPFIPAPLRPSWPSSVDVGFGLYDFDMTKPKPWPLLDVAVVRSNIANALRHSDSWIWLFTEKIDFLKPASTGGAPAAWVDAVRMGKEDGLTGWKPPWP